MSDETSRPSPSAPPSPPPSHSPSVQQPSPSTNPPQNTNTNTNSRVTLPPLFLRATMVNYFSSDRPTGSSSGKMFTTNSHKSVPVLTAGTSHGLACGLSGS
ncbi:uncharacterized protein LOC124897715 isoform X2 [Capsicum annuum]|uniref:uncharacterized protein LOC124897715 isoform X2 n=1 Tax=Capsicum annuum TaxID=4072 RepID=UPI001FB0BDF0|nr:uncharacterized protein LOC124897715 isoform X2 [Capsicum annuum]